MDSQPNNVNNNFQGANEPQLVAAAPVMDPSQPGYVPPVMTPQGPSLQVVPTKPHGSKIGLLITIIVFALLTFGGAGYYLLKDTLFTGSKITKDDLVETSESGVTFKHPKDWKKVPSTDFDVLYTEGGKSSKESDQGVFVSAQDIGFNFDELSDADMTDEVDQQISSFKSAIVSDPTDCPKLDGLKVESATKTNYTRAIKIEYNCSGFKNRNTTGHYEFIYGIKGSNFHMVGIAALEDTWTKSGDALNEILVSFKPANQ